MVTNPTTDRPWPAPSPDAEWWRTEPTATPVPPPLPTPVPPSVPVPVAASVPAPSPEDAPADAPEPEEPGKDLVPVPVLDDGFPLWPDVSTVDATVETPVVEVHQRQSLDEWPPPLMRASLQSRASTATAGPRRPVKTGKDKPLRHLRRPGTGLAWLVLVALFASFFAWTSAEPFWLAVGHAQAGTATVTRCAGDGVLRRCIANFAGPGFTAEGVTLLGAQGERERSEGATLSARMVRHGDRIAYAGSPDGLHVRWGVGLGLTMLCGVLIAWVTGARRLLGGKARAGAVLLSFLGPLLLFGGMLAATY